MSGSGSNIYSPGGGQLNTANNAYNTLLPQQVSAAQSVASVPSQVQTLTSNFQSNPYSAGAQSGANTASQYGTGTVVPGMQQGAGALQGLGGQAAGYGQQALASGFDPQSALYNFGAQQTVDQQNAINSMSGVSNSPYGAGTTGQALTNFNLGWDQNQLQRQQTAANTANTLTGTANTAYQGAGQLGAGAVQGQAQYANLPSQTYEQNILSQLQGLSAGNQATSGASGITDQAMSQILAYLGYGTQATSAQQQADTSAWSGIGNFLGTLGGAALGNTSLFQAS